MFFTTFPITEYPDGNVMFSCLLEIIASDGHGDVEMIVVSSQESFVNDNDGVPLMIGSHNDGYSFLR